MALFKTPHNVLSLENPQIVSCDGTIPLQESLNAYPLISLPVDLSVYHGQYSSSNLYKDPLETLSHKPIDNTPSGNISECNTHIFMDGHETDNPSGVKITNS